jgi:hypothetical protein
VVEGDEALLVFGEDPVAGRDVAVERVGEFLSFGGLDYQQAGAVAVMVDIADAVVAPTLDRDVVQQLSQLRVGVVLVPAGALIANSRVSVGGGRRGRLRGR